MKKLTLVMSFFLFQLNLYAQKASSFNKAILQGQIKDRITSKPLETVKINLNKRVWDIMPDGLPSLHPISEIKETGKNICTKKNGTYKSKIKLVYPKEYYTLHITAKGYESLDYTLVVLEQGKTTTINLDLIKLNPTPAEQKIIKEKEELDWQKINDDKIKDEGRINILQKSFSKTENGPQQNMKMAGCSYTVPASFYVINLSSGYNSYSCPVSGTYTGFMPQNEYVGGCVAQEMGASFPTEALKAQAVAARTYGLKRMNAGSGANCGQAYSLTPSAVCTTAATNTNNQVLLYNNSLIEALYSARCSGSYTQTASLTGCFSFNPFPYLQCVTCSGHAPCTGGLCTSCFNSCLGSTVSIYGHGVGMCQRGAEGFANLGNNYTWILDHFYGGIVCLANVGPPPSLDCTNPISLTCNQPYSGTTVGGNSNISNYSCQTWVDSGPEIVHTFTTSGAGIITATISGLNPGVDLDVWILSACDPSLCLGSVSSNGATTNTSVLPGLYYIVVDGYLGDSGPYTLTVTGNCSQPCIDQYETNDACPTATQVFVNPLGNGSSNYTINANIGYAGDQDWYKVTTNACGQLDITLSNLPYNYDLELYGICGGLALAGAYQPGTGTEQISHLVNLSSLTTYYIKVYPNIPSTFTTSSCYQITFQWASSSVTPSVSIAVNPATTICLGQTATFTATPINGGTAPAYQWYVDGMFAGIGNPIPLTLTLGTHQVYCDMASNANCVSPPTATSNTITMTVNQTVVPSITISANPTGTICAGTSVTFTATATNGGSSPSYQWKNNGSNVGGSSPTYTTSSLANGNVITCVLTSNANCASPTMATSNSITMTVDPVVVPSVSISANTTTICAGTCATFTAILTNGGSSPVYQWKKNGFNVGTNPSYTDCSLVNGDQIQCDITSNANCANPATASSNTFIITVNPLPIPVISFLNMCTFQTTLPYSQYLWYMNGSLAPGINNQPTYTVNPPVSGSTYFTVQVTDANNCTGTSTTQFFGCIVGINEKFQGMGFNIFPNPTNDFLNIKGEELNNGNLQITLTNTLGQSLKNQSIKIDNQKLETTIDMKDLASGIYFLSISSEQATQVFKVQKQ